MFSRFACRLVAAPLSVALALATLTVSYSSHADDADKARAVQLFMDGKQLMEKGQYPDACPKLEESFRLEPVDGTLLRYAWCEEMLGKLATAWALFTRGLASAKTANNADRIKFAIDHLAAIEPKLSKVMIHVSSVAQIDGLEIRWDGKLIGKGAWNDEFPVDPGNHTLSAGAPGKQMWTTSIGVGANGDHRTVEIPQLLATSTTTSSEKAPNTARASRVPAYIALGAGGLFLAGGVGAFVLRKGAQSDRESFCAAQTTPTCPDDDSKSRIHRWDTISYVSAGLGLVGVAVGVVLLATPSSTGTTMQVGAGTLGSGSGVLFSGAF